MSFINKTAFICLLAVNPSWGASGELPMLRSDQLVSVKQEFPEHESVFGNFSDLEYKNLEKLEPQLTQKVIDSLVETDEDSLLVTNTMKRAVKDTNYTPVIICLASDKKCLSSRLTPNQYKMPPLMDTAKRLRALAKYQALVEMDSQIRHTMRIFNSSCWSFENPFNDHSSADIIQIVQALQAYRYDKRFDTFSHLVCQYIYEIAKGTQQGADLIINEAFRSLITRNPEPRLTVRKAKIDRMTAIQKSILPIHYELSEVIAALRDSMSY